MTISDGLLILAVIVGPILAVQVDNILESMRDDKKRRIWIFKTLMATRALNVSPDHVQSLNMIDLEFRGKKYTGVTLAWKTYLDHLNSYPRDQRELQPVWRQDSAKFLTKLLLEMGKSLGYKELDEVQIKKGIYYPEAHGLIEDQMSLIRNGIIKVLYGETKLLMNVTDFPSDQEAIEKLKYLHSGLTDLVDGKRPLPVEIIKSVEDNKRE